MVLLWVITLLDQNRGHNQGQQLRRKGKRKERTERKSEYLFILRNYIMIHERERAAI